MTTISPHSYIVDHAAVKRLAEAIVNSASRSELARIWTQAGEKVARAYLDLLAKHDGPSSKGWIALEDRLPTANDAGAEGTVLAWFPGAKEARTRHWKIVQAWQVSEDDDSMRGAFWMPLPNIPDATLEKE